MDRIAKNGGQNRVVGSASDEAGQLLRAVGIDLSDHDLRTRAAFRALAEEVLDLRDRESALKKALSEAERLADHDALCPVFNRRAFERELTREIALAQRHSLPLCLVYLDLDRFKAVNDTFGHKAGDKTLLRVCDIILSQVRQTDIVGRLGGDEFGVILTHAELADSQLKADRLTARIDRLRVGGDLYLGASCGVMSWSGQPSAEAFIAEADEAMFRVKSARKTNRH
ncbi:GGDEF domain-containing protein [Henriciella sp. AS95]|uniref:GGDEF domain-containing protein n=1 Tax=Henriciella sp. AS95 TaxID=3135782 RepID=UPI00317B18DD